MTEQDHSDRLLSPQNPPPQTSIQQAILDELDEAENKAWDSLARYKFMMFGYWAGIWVHLNRISGAKRPNPWKPLTQLAREQKAAQQEDRPLQPMLHNDLH